MVTVNYSLSLKRSSAQWRWAIERMRYQSI